MRARAWPAVSRPVLHHGLHAVGQLQQAQRVGDMAAALADDLGELLLAVVEALDQLAIARRLFDGVEVGALHVLDDGKLENFFVGEVARDDRNGVQAGLLRRAPAPLAGDDLVAALGRAHDDRLHEALGADRLGELGQLVLAEVLARIEPARAHIRRSAPALLALRRQRGWPPGTGSPISEASPRPRRLFCRGAFMVSSAGAS